MGRFAIAATPRAASEPASLDHCSLCKAPIHLRAPVLAAPARPWLCGGCGSVYFACSADGGIGERSGKARVVPFEQVVDVASMNADSINVRLPRQALKELIMFLSRKTVIFENQRKESRYAAILPVIALPLGRNFRIVGEAVHMTTINISRSGASLLDVETCTASYLALDFSIAGLSARAVLEVLRRRPVLSAYEIAGRLRCRIV